MSRQVRFALRLVVGGSVLAIVIAHTNATHLSVPWGPRLFAGLAAVVVIILTAQGTAALRWRTIIGREAPPAQFLWKLYLVGTFFSLFLPTAVGGDAVRAAAASKALGRTGSALASVFLDRLFGILALVCYMLIGAVLAPRVLAPVVGKLEWGIPPAAIAISVAVFLVIVWFLWRALDARGKIPRQLRDGSEVARALWRNPSVSAVAFALSLVVQGFYIFAWAVLATALRLHLGWSVFLASVPLVSLATMLPVTISGLGLREGAWVLLLGPFGIPSGRVVVYSLSYFLCLVCVGVIGGILFIARGTALKSVLDDVPFKPSSKLSAAPRGER